MEKNKSNLWEYSVHDGYKNVPEKEDWQPCPVCSEKPMIWEFDNGRHAKCLCADKFGPPIAEAQAIMTIYRRDGNLDNYNRGELRKNWNEYVEWKNYVKTLDK